MALSEVSPAPIVIVVGVAPLLGLKTGGVSVFQPPSSIYSVPLLRVDVSSVNTPDVIVCAAARLLASTE